jgi:hypothetical protein
LVGCLFLFFLFFVLWFWSIQENRVVRIIRDSGGTLYKRFHQQTHKNDVSLSHIYTTLGGALFFLFCFQAELAVSMKIGICEWFFFGGYLSSHRGGSRLFTQQPEGSFNTINKST